MRMAKDKGFIKVYFGGGRVAYIPTGLKIHIWVLFSLFGSRNQYFPP